MCLSPKEIIDKYIQGTQNKMKQSSLCVFAKAIFAGMMIGMGAASSSVAAHNIEQVGIARLVAAVVFPVGLMMVILLGAELFTGDCLMAAALPEKKISILKLTQILFLVYVGNFVGSFVLCELVYMSGQFDYSAGLLGAYTIKIAVGKVNINPVASVTSGICCNILVCAAVLMALAAKDVVGKIMSSFFVIMLFVVAGYEHCVANMYYITAGLIAKSNSSYVNVAMEHYGISANKLHSLNLRNMLVNNLLPVTIGNIIGGAIVIGIPLYYLTRERKAVCEEDVVINTSNIKKIGVR